MIPDTSKNIDMQRVYTRDAQSMYGLAMTQCNGVVSIMLGNPKIVTNLFCLQRNKISFIGQKYWKRSEMNSEMTSEITMEMTSEMTSMITREMTSEMTPPFLLRILTVSHHPPHTTSCKIFQIIVAFH